VTPQALLVTGTVGVGKTSVAHAVGDLLRAAEVPNAVVDLDALSQAWPAPPGDPFNFALELRNLRAVAANFLAAGAERLVLAGVVENLDGRERYREALGLPLTVARLRAGLDEVARRLHGRHRDDEDGLRWHLHRSGELDAILDAAGVADFEVSTDGRSVTEVAAEVLVLVRWR
jgi:adenylylsulfate kinase